MAATFTPGLRPVTITFGVLPAHDESGDLLANVELAEALGFDSVWLGDHVLWYTPSPDPMVLLGACAARSERIRLGTGVYLAALRPAPVVAKQAATLDQLSQGRFVLGVGIGGENPAEFENVGVDVKRRARRLEETVEACRALWSSGGEPVTYEGRDVRLHEARFDYPPFTPGGPAIWMGGRAEGALRRAGRLAEGWLAFVVDAPRFRESWARVRGYAEEAGRDPGTMTPGLQLWCQLDPDEDAALAVIAPAIERMYRTPYERFERYCIAGGPDRWIERLGEFIDAGVRHFNLVFAGGSVGVQMALFAEMVMPAFADQR